MIFLGICYLWYDKFSGELFLINVCGGKIKEYGMYFYWCIIGCVLFYFNLMDFFFFKSC